MRRAMQAILAALPAPDIEARSLLIAGRLAQTAAWSRADAVLCFLSMPREIDTTGLIRAARAAGKAVAVPRIEGGEIAFQLLPEGAPTPARDRWGIPVPDPAWPAFAPARAARLLVAAPGLAFDRQGNRLGRGKGYYDRFLSRTRASSADLTVIGICFAEQLVEAVPHGESDQRIDGVVTDGESMLFPLS